MEAINQRKVHHIAEMIRRNISELRKSGADISKEANEVFDMIDDLAVELLKSTPPRNCDVGTSKEQVKRFDEHCRLCNGSCCDHRLSIIENKSFRALDSCVLEWSQMPYKEGDSNGK